MCWTLHMCDQPIYFDGTTHVFKLRQALKYLSEWGQKYTLKRKAKGDEHTPAWYRQYTSLEMNAQNPMQHFTYYK